MIPRNRKPATPGEILQKEFLEPLELSQVQLAEHLGGTWKQSKISDIVRGKRRITEAIALDLADAFGTSPQFWLNLQQACDLWVAAQDHQQIDILPNLVA